VTRRRIPADELVAWIIELVDATPHRLLLGITGAPGSGKSTITQRVAKELDATVVPMDGFHLLNAVLDQRGLRSVKGAPETFDAAGFLRAIRDIRSAEKDISLPDFDRCSDEPRPDYVQVPASSPIVIVEGNYLLLELNPWFELRRLFDVIAHLDIDPAVRVQRLIDRHIRFGKTPADAADFVHASDEPNAALIEAARHRAHVIVETGSSSTSAAKHREPTKGACTPDESTLNVEGRSRQGGHVSSNSCTRT
jgi:pantothenate kinase